MCSICRCWLGLTDRSGWQREAAEHKEVNESRGLSVRWVVQQRIPGWRIRTVEGELKVQGGHLTERNGRASAKNKTRDRCAFVT